MLGSTKKSWGMAEILPSAFFGKKYTEREKEQKAIAEHQLVVRFLAEAAKAAAIYIQTPQDGAGD